MTSLPTRNPHWGFHGTLACAGAVDADEAWALASDAIAAVAGASPEGVRDFLDSRRGRHFADDVVNGLCGPTGLREAIDAAITRWMGWRIGRDLSRETGIPAHLPCLTGLIAHFEIMADAG